MRLYGGAFALALSLVGFGLLLGFVSGNANQINTYGGFLLLPVIVLGTAVLFVEQGVLAVALDVRPFRGGALRDRSRRVARAGGVVPGRLRRADAGRRSPVAARPGVLPPASAVGARRRRRYAVAKRPSVRSGRTPGRCSAKMRW